MQVIKMYVRNQRLWRYTSGVITEGANLKFEFVFKTEDWSAATQKTAVFSYAGKNYEEKLDENNQCYVPKDIVYSPSFKASIYGGGIITNTVKIPVESHKLSSKEEVYQYIDAVIDDKLHIENGIGLIDGGKIIQGGEANA